MSDPHDRNPSAETVASEANSEGLFERIKLALGLKPSPSLREDLAEAIGSDASDFTTEERALLKNILGPREKLVDDIMVPRADTISGSLETSLAEL